jgi:hypothetical protein
MHHSTDSGVLSVSEVSLLANDTRIINTKSGLIVNQMDVEIIRH